MAGSMDRCLTRVVSGVVMGGAVGGALGEWLSHPLKFVDVMRGISLCLSNPGLKASSFVSVC